jgi:S-DNA-T family DNA segregation ATPase FtsK/SpoIIIE
MASGKKSFKINIVYNSIYALIGGIGLEVFAPLFDADPNSIGLTKIIKGIGVVGLTYYAWTWSKFDKLFENLGLGVNGAYPIFKSKHKSQYSTIYKFTLPAGLCLSDFDKCKEKIEQHLGRDIDIKYTYKEIYMEVYNDNLKTKFDYVPIKIKGDVPILIGYNRHDELIYCDLAEGEPHMLIAGETGSGKSTTLRSMICNLILQSDVKLHLIDLKMGAEFNVFSKSNKVINFGRTMKDAYRILSDISIKVDRRYNLFFKNDVKDIKEYNKKFKNKKLDYQILIIDEFADLQSEHESMKLIEDLGRKARACGIHLILATQRPDHKVLTGNIKVNVGTVLGLKTLNSTNSNIIIDTDGLEKLRGKGHGLFKRGNITEIQSPFISTDEVKGLIQHTYINKPYKDNEVKNGNVSEESLKEAINHLC